MKESKSAHKVTKLEVDLLLLFYNLSDQNGKVDIQNAALWAKNKLGVDIPNTPFTLTQRHFDFLMDRGVIPDTRIMIQKLMNPPKPPSLTIDAEKQP